MTTPEPRTALVTGASSGIGSAIAVAFGALGWRVVLAARRAELLQEVGLRVETAGGKALAVRCDVTEPEEIEALFDAAESRFGPVEVAVANAGTALPALLHETTCDQIGCEIRTNLLHPLLLARRALPSMRARGRGDLVFVSSEAAIRPRPFQVGYAASKRGLEAAAEALRMELEGTGVRTTVVRPGATASAFGAGWSADTVRRVLTAWKHWGVQRHLRLMPPERTAEAVVHAVTSPPGTQVELVQVAPEGPVEMRIA